MFWKAVTGGLLLALSADLLGWGAEGQEDRRGKKEVSGGATIYLGQDRAPWRPLIHTTVNLSDITSIKSTFQLRTFDPEGAMFYGDTKRGGDWFVLSLMDGVPVMQISRGGVQISVAGGPKLNDGEWHTLEVSNQGMFVLLEVDGSDQLVVGMQSQNSEEVRSGELRLALGGILIDNDRMMVQFDPKMDGCLRGGSWLNLSIPWESEVEELQPCYQDVRPGGYFTGAGFAVFNASVLSLEGGRVVRAELQGDFSQMDGTVLSIRTPGEQLTLALVTNNHTKEVTLTLGKDKLSLKAFRRLLIMFQTDSLQLVPDDDESKINTLAIGPMSRPGYLTMWTEGRLAIGGLLGEGEDSVGSQFLTGCLEKIQVQGRDLDLDLAVKHKSISSHSCPA
ncbi:sex hormone-binding globulin [Antennarius striatus]|uniref:sex hormone-binding globulin n=1 Tax=Antennarius striatus TaxID=241820 RepID=UPI0035B06B58